MIKEFIKAYFFLFIWLINDIMKIEQFYLNRGKRANKIMKTCWEDKQWQRNRRK